MLLDTLGAHIVGCRTTQQGFGGVGIAARASAGTSASEGRAGIAAGAAAEQRPAKNAMITMPISAPPAPYSDETGTATGVPGGSGARLGGGSERTSGGRSEARAAG